MRLPLAAAVLLPLASPARAATEVSPLSLTFEDQAVGTLSSAKTVRVTTARRWWYSSIPQRRVIGDDPEDFLVTRRDCDADGSYSPTGHCVELRVRFAPGAASARSATLRIQNPAHPAIPAIPARPGATERSRAPSRSARGPGA